MQEQDQEQNVITIVLTADNHLGYSIPGQPARKCDELRQRLRRAFQMATDFAIGQGVDLFVQAGDLFDTSHPDEQDRSFVAERLAELKQAGIRAFALGGLHDTPVEMQMHQGDALTAALAPQLSYARLGALHYFPPLAVSQSGETLSPVLLDIRGTLVGLCGFSATQHAGPSGDPLAHIRIDGEIERAAIPLLLLSMPLDEEAVASALSQISFRAVLAGYAHDFQRFTSGQTDVIVAGATQRFDLQDPASEPGFVFLGIAADGVRWCRHVAVDSIHLRRLEIPLAQWWSDTDTTDDEEDAAGATEPTMRLLEELRPLCTEDAMVQLRLTGEISRQRYHQLELSSIRRYGEAHTFAFDIDDSALTFLPGDETQTSRRSAFEERLSPREELIALADEWIAAAQDEQERKALLATKEELLAALWTTALHPA
ncbi:MAG TPA: metallophosphoesterase [Ktedonobacteraceae bacterium]|nr:metallophosphoesterase [Ktedonobacteraceae bacterium]